MGLAVCGSISLDSRCTYAVEIKKMSIAHYTEKFFRSVFDTFIANDVI